MYLIIKYLTIYNKIIHLYNTNTNDRKFTHSITVREQIKRFVNLVESSFNNCWQNKIKLLPPATLVALVSVILR